MSCGFQPGLSTPKRGRRGGRRYSIVIPETCSRLRHRDLPLHRRLFARDGGFRLDAGTERKGSGHSGVHPLPKRQAGLEPNEQGGLSSRHREFQPCDFGGSRLCGAVCGAGGCLYMAHLLGHAATRRRWAEGQARGARGSVYGIGPARRRRKRIRHSELQRFFSIGSGRKA